MAPAAASALHAALFLMRLDGSNVRQLTDNQWEDGTPAWQPAVK